MRDDIIEELLPLISDLITKAKAGRFRGDEKNHRLRISYINALSNLLKTFNNLLKDKEVEELEEEILHLKELIEDDKHT